MSSGSNLACPSAAKTPPSGPEWIHEIKHDGFRIVAHRDARGVRLVTRSGFDFAFRMGNILAFAIVGALCALTPVATFAQSPPWAGWAGNRKPEIGLVDNRRQVSDR